MAFNNLNLLSIVDPFEKYQKIAESKTKYKSVLYGTESRKSITFGKIKKCYRIYKDNENNLEVISPWTGFSENEKYALLHCYTGNTKLVRELREDIISNQNIHYRTKCGYI